MAAESELEARRPKKRTRIMIDVSPELRRRIKLAAAREDVTIRDYLERIIEAAVPAAAPAEQVSGRRPLSKEHIEQLRAFQRQLAEEHPGVIFEDSAEAIRKMREERTAHLESL